MNELKKRTLKSFAMLIAFFALVFIGWNRINSSDEDLPPVMRKTLEANGHLWHSLFNLSRIDDSYKTTRKPPRVNGLIGLEARIDPAQWKLMVSGGKTTFELTLDQIKALPRTESVAEFRCIEGWSQVISYAGV